MSRKPRKNSIFDIMGEQVEGFYAFADKLMEAAFSEGPSWNRETCCLQALSSVFVTQREVVVTADLPNIEPETVKVKAADKTVIEITAKMKKKVQFSDLGIYHREGEFSSLHCQDRVQVAVDAEKMKISFIGGVLEVRFPRKES
jgi:HSP20 family molecular chaperone IbpA